MLSQKNITEQIKNYLSSLPKLKQADMQRLHTEILKIEPHGKLWFLDGKNDQGKVVSNPNIGYGAYTIRYADGSTREFYRIGMSANTTGISIYIMGLKDKNLLATNYKQTLGKATITGYCIKFKSLEDINIDVLLSAIKLGLECV